jgi:hypothetical protein
MLYLNTQKKLSYMSILNFRTSDLTTHLPFKSVVIIEAFSIQVKEVRFPRYWKQDVPFKCGA